MKIFRHTPLSIGLVALIIISYFTIGHEAVEHEEEGELVLETDEDILPFLNLGDDNDGFKIDEEFTGSIDDENRSREEKALDDAYEKSVAEHKTKNIFEKVCPFGYFKCLNGECISPKWRCDGHYDCDDFSDEINCTTIVIPPAGDMSFDHHVKSTTPKPKSSSSLSSTVAKQEEISIIKFNTSTEPLMLFSTGTSIRGYWMQSRIYFDVYGMGLKQAPKLESSSITQALSVFFDFLNDRALTATPSRGDHEAPKAKNTIVGLDMNPNNKEVFWVELGHDAGVYSTAISGDQFESRHRRQFNGPLRKTIVDSGLISPEDIALDTLGRNLYITDAGLPAIVVCSIRNSHCRIIVKDKLHKPRAIIADSSTGWLTYTDWGDHPGIYLVSMDGKRRETLIDTDVVWPNGLAADYTSNQLYWADARLSKIERIDLATMKRREVIKEAASNPFSLSLFENRIYWSDWSGNDIRTCDKMSGNNTKAIMRTDNIYGIHIYHPTLDRSRDLDNPCWSKYCSHMCLLSPQTSFARRTSRPISAVCSCPESMALSIGDHATCYEVQLSFLLVNVKNYIAQVFPEQIGLRTVQKVIYSKDHIIHDVASDWLNYRLFFFDAVKKHIYSVELSHKDVKIDQFLQDKKSVRGLLYDPWSDNLYWLDPEHGTMSMCPVKAKYETIMRRDFDRPVSLVLDSKNRVFYIAMLGSMPHILRTNIFAHEDSDRIIINSGEIGLPVAMHLDEQQQRLYWADARYETIESLDLDLKSKSGVKIHTRIHHKGKLGTILAFTVYHDHFLWMNKNGEYLYKAKIDDHQKEQRQVNLRLPPNPSNQDPTSDNKRIIVVDPRHEVIVSPCRNAGCSHGCVMNSNHSAICVCPDGYKTRASNKTKCVLDEHKPEVTTHLPVDTSVIHDDHIEVKHIELPPHFESGHLEIPHIETPHIDSPHVVDVHTHTDALHIDIPHKETPTAHVDIAHQVEVSPLQHKEIPHNEALSNNKNGLVGDEISSSAQEVEDAESSLTWLILLLLLLVMAGLITLASILFIFKPRNVSHLLVNFRSHHDKEGRVVLLDD